MDIGTFRGIVTAVLMLAFVALVIWAYGRRRHVDFAAAARLPLEDGASKERAVDDARRAVNSTPQRS
jgi:cytochrome c oxidase cbb3-type subunit 4